MNCPFNVRPSSLAFFFYLPTFYWTYCSVSYKTAQQKAILYLWISNAMFNLLFHHFDNKMFFRAAVFSNISVISSSAVLSEMLFTFDVLHFSMRGGSTPLMHSTWPSALPTCTPLDVSIYLLITFTLPSHSATFAAAPQSLCSLFLH